MRFSREKSVLDLAGGYLKAGGRRVVDPWVGMRCEGDEKMHTAVGQYKLIDRPSELVFTWQWQEGGPDQADTQVTIELQEGDGTTEMVLTHERSSNAAARDEHAKGWSGCLDRLGEFMGR